MRVSVDEAGGDKSSLAVVLIGHGIRKLARLAPLLAAPGDLFAIEDHGGALYHADRRAREEAPDVAEALHLCTTVWPPTTTLVTSRPDRP